MGHWPRHVLIAAGFERLCAALFIDIDIHALVHGSTAKLVTTQSNLSVCGVYIYSSVHGMP